MSRSSNELHKVHKLSNFILRILKNNVKFNILCYQVHAEFFYLFGVFMPLTPYQQYFSYLTATVHKSMFLALFLSSTYPVHYPDTAGQS